MTSQLAERQTPASLPTGRGKGPGGQPGGWPPPGQCPVPGCGDPIDVTRLMCRRDWYLLPRPLRDQVWATWCSGDGAAGREHQEAVLQAIAGCRAAGLEAAARPAAANPTHRIGFTDAGHSAAPASPGKVTECRSRKRLSTVLCRVSGADAESALQA